MGQCGCGDYGGEFRLPGPGKDIYVIEFYGGCKYCDTPAGIILYRMNGEDQELWGTMHLPELKMTDFDGGRLLPVFHLREFQDTLANYFETLTDEIAGEDMARSAAFDTWGKWMKDQHDDKEGE